MPSLIVFDVGHGSCVFLEDGPVRTLFDCGSAQVFVEFLLAKGLDRIEQIVISHADEDHLAGVSALVQSDYVSIGTVYVNPDAKQDSIAWNELKLALQDAVDRGHLQVVIGIGSGMASPLNANEVSIELVSPGIAWGLTGNGGKAPDGKSLNANNMSVVARLHHKGCPVVLLPGDMEMATLDDIINRKRELAAEILLFPHHGGHVHPTGTSDARKLKNSEFTAKLLERCAPKVVLFSIGRGQHSTPRPEIVTAILAQKKGCMISCTQLSDRCHAGTSPTVDGHLNALPAIGKSRKSCCGGSMQFQLNGADTVTGIDRKAHADFIAASVSHPQCMQN